MLAIVLLSLAQCWGPSSRLAVASPTPVFVHPILPAFVHPIASPPAKKCEVTADCKCGCEEGKRCKCAARPSPPPRPTYVPKPLPPPSHRPSMIEADGPKFGVDEEKLGEGKAPCYRIGGKEVSKAKAWAAITAPSLPDEKGKLRLTIIGDEGSRKRIRADIESSPGVKSSVVVQDYPPDHWAVKGAGFFAGGSPTIYLQAADGKVLHRQDDYEGGIIKLAEAVRKAKPDYKPEADPNLNKPNLIPDAWIAWLKANWHVAALSALGLFLLLKKDETKK